jgi:hypothetical protein
MAVRSSSATLTEQTLDSPYTHLLSNLFPASPPANSPSGAVKRSPSVVTAKKPLGSATPKLDPAAACTASDVVTFIDTPGHSAFFRMRENGASVADFILLIIAADEGVREQTLESIKIAKDAHTPVVVAINKIDIASKEKVEAVYYQLHRFKLMPKKLTHASNPLNAPNGPDFEFVLPTRECL